jgi:hypothetical protein
MSEEKIMSCILAGLFAGVGAGMLASGLGHNVSFSYGVGFLGTVGFGALFILIAKIFDIMERIQ